MRKILVLLLFFGVSACQIFESADKDVSDKELEILYDEIVQLAESESCSDAAQWKFTAIGSKPCGGPTGYIAYSSQLDEASFLDKVKRYNQLMADYNAKNNRFSDCMYLSPPSQVICEAGKPVLVYD
ncbi:hypothetical protein [Algoriphagus vanfongensis]|uniref:hypothetical protein n=1 Tax=Algoriphagus vanfongensis TaxID=426371 RepID=UPI0004223C6E|nr:hypothetical protein [Algoriphagus vanfongensis]